MLKPMGMAIPTPMKKPANTRARLAPASRNSWPLATRSPNWAITAHGDGIPAMPMTETSHHNPMPTKGLTILSVQVLPVKAGMSFRFDTVGEVIVYPYIVQAFMIADDVYHESKWPRHQVRCPITALH